MKKILKGEEDYQFIANNEGCHYEKKYIIVYSINLL